MAKSLIWNSLDRWQKTLLVILAIVVLPVTLIGIIVYLITKSSDSQTFAGPEKWHFEKENKKVQNVKEELEGNRDETRKILIRRKDRLDKIGRTNKDAEKLLTDIHNADNADELENIRKRIRFLK